MSEYNESTRLKIEDELTANLSGDNLKNALDYIAYMKASGIAPATPDSNVFMYGDECVCVLVMYPIDDVPGWTAFMGGYDSALCRGDFQDYPVDEALKEFAWSRVSTCGGCGCGFQPGRRVKLLGKTFDNVCTSLLYIRDPDVAALETVKRFTDVFKQSIIDAAKKTKTELDELKENEWPSVRDISAQTGRPLGKAYAESLDVAFTLTLRQRYLDSAIAFSGDGWIPASWEQIPVALRMGSNSRFEAFKGPDEGFTAVDPLKYQANVAYLVEMSINVTNNAYSVTIWMLDRSGEKDAPYRIAVDFPFHTGDGDASIPKMTAIDTIYLGPGLGIGNFAYVVKDFKVINGR